MTRSLYLVSGCVMALLCACGSGNQSTPDAGVDMNADALLCQGAGCIGATCSADTDCTEGSGSGQPTCWTTTLLNNTQFVTTPGGYCTRQCQTDADCGTAKCVAFPSSGSSYCMARCSSATRCRKPGYSCAYDGDGGICFPNANFNCNPSTGDGTCEFGANKYLGGCYRVAYESDQGGVCHLQCVVGTATCPADSNSLVQPPPPQQCIYLDTTVDDNGNPTSTGDKFKGNLCFDQPATPIAAGMPCTYWTDCGDGYQCDRFNITPANRVCRQLCAQGGPQNEPPGLLVPTGANPATSQCSDSTQGCANSLHANLQVMGVPGLCQPSM